MDLSLGGAGGSDDEHNAFNSQMRKKSAHRHTASQIQRLEAFYKDCPHPDENQRNELGRELGLQPKQIKFWFQNKRTQIKTLNERTDNNILRAENERMECENFAIKEALKGVNCPSCGGPSFGDEERELTLQKLLHENAHLKEEYEKATKLLASYAGTPMTPHIETLSVRDLGMSISDDNSNMLPKQDMDKALMLETAISAMEEVVRLLRVNDPLWIKSEVSQEEEGAFFVPNRDSYERIFPRAHHFNKSFNARVESSKASRIVRMTGMQLVDMFLDSDKWVNLFPTIVTKAHIMKVIESGLSGSRNGALQLMYEEMHILTPMVPPRDFVFLRYCYQMDIATWVIADVSFDSLEDNDITYSASWRLPSGCMIKELPNGSSKVTWVEHVEVDGKTLTHRLYRDLVYSNVAYGAERWVVALQRMCERIAFSLTDDIPFDEAGGVVSLPEGRRSLMKLGHRMIKSFCGVIKMSSGRVEYPELSEGNDSGIRVSVCKNVQRGQPDGMTLTAATCVWLPLPPPQVFDFLKDETRRVQWDVLCNGNSEQEIERISTGTHPGNYMSIIRTESNVVILQETCVEPMGCLVVYAPVDVSAMNVVFSGEDSAAVPILPSGFVVAGDGSPNSDGVGGGSSSSENSGGSILTMAFQILVCSPTAVRRLNMESVASVNTLITTTLHRIKVALNC